MKNSIFYILIFISCLSNAQQSVRYTQYTTNVLGLNPAFAGTHNNIEFVVGRRMQWYGFENAPTQTFGSGSYTFKDRRKPKLWHAISLYAEEDRQGVFVHKSAYLGYAIHLRLFTGVIMSAGIFAGAKQSGLSSKIQNNADPALSQAKLFWLYPDLIPGIRIYSKKFFYDLSVRQLYKDKNQQGNDKFGVNSKLSPHVFMTFGRKFRDANNEFLFIPSVHLQTSIPAIPSIEGSFYVYYKQRIGVGARYSVNNAVSGILQVHFLKNAMIGLAYDYTITKFRLAAANSYEVMLAFIPRGGDEDKTFNRNRVAKCPEFDF